MCVFLLQKKKRNFSRTISPERCFPTRISRLKNLISHSSSKKSVQSLHVERAPLSHEKRNIPAAIRLFDKKYLHGARSVQFDQLSYRYTRNRAYFLHIENILKQFLRNVSKTFKTYTSIAKMVERRNFFRVKSKILFNKK